MGTSRLLHRHCNGTRQGLQVLQWYFIGAAMILYCHCAGTGRVLHRPSTFTAQALHCYCTAIVLVLHWYCTILRWYCMGMTLVLYCHLLAASACGSSMSVRHMPHCRASWADLAKQLLECTRPLASDSVWPKLQRLHCEKAQRAPWLHDGGTRRCPAFNPERSLCNTA